MFSLAALLALVAPYALPVTFAVTAIRALPDATRLQVIAAAAAGGAIGSTLAVWLASLGLDAWFSLPAALAGAVQGALLGVAVLLVHGNRAWFLGRP